MFDSLEIKSHSLCCWRDSELWIKLSPIWTSCFFSEQFLISETLQFVFMWSLLTCRQLSQWKGTELNFHLEVWWQTSKTLFKMLSRKRIWCSCHKNGRKQLEDTTWKTLLYQLNYWCPFSLWPNLTCAFLLNACDFMCNQEARPALCCVLTNTTVVQMSRLVT